MAKSNLGMYRVQLSGGSYEKDREIGLHYQIHRGIGAHHAEAIARDVPWSGFNYYLGDLRSRIVVNAWSSRAAEASVA